ncbi:MAG: histidine--tRNA ligase [Devosiaceae bacterium]
MSNKKTKKPQKVKARLPRGFVDRDAGDIRALDAMMGKIRGVYERYGFDPVETPLFEYTDTLGKFLPDTDRPNEGVFSVQDDDEQWMSLRYDLTAPLARYVAENYDALPKPYRSYRAGYVFRNEKPGPGRFRQFMQFDADSVGAPGVQADAEMCMMMADTMEALGIPRGQYVIRVNNRKVLDGVMEAIGVTDDAQKLAVLRAIDKLDKFGVEGVKLLLGEGRWDGGAPDKGDFTKGAGLAAIQLDTVLKMIGEPIEDYDGERFLGHLDYVFEQSELAKNASADVGDLVNLVQSCGYQPDRITADPTVVRGLEYYTGMVYEAELLFPVTNEKGEEVVFGSVGGGGRYDGLVSRFRGEPVPATGFSIGVSRLMTPRKNLGKISTHTPQGPVIVCVMDRDIDALAGYQKMTQALRDAKCSDFPNGIRAEMFQGNPRQFGKQLQYADRRNAPLCIIQGSQERETGVVQIKDMIEGKREAAAFESNADYKAARTGQYEVLASDLVAEVKKRLSEQEADQ